MAVLNSSVIVGDLSITGKVLGAAEQVYASIGDGNSAPPSGVDAGNKYICIVSAMPATPAPNTIYFVIN